MFFYILLGHVVLFVLSFFIKELFLFGQLLLAVFVGVVCFDIFLLFKNRYGIEVTRTIPEKLSNGDKNIIRIELKNKYTIPVFIQIIDEIPAQFQIRNFSINAKIEGQSTKIFPYDLVPTQRGQYLFGNTHVFVKSILNLVTKKYTLEKETTTKTYPSFLKLKQFDLKTINSLSSAYGVKKVRRIGNSFEFEQIKEYVQGDNIKDINWKATAKKNQLMVNQFVDEKAQNVYMLIDRGRTMKMPFNGLSLLDYAINASLIVSNVVIQKQDKAGLFSFSKNINDYVSAERRNHQLGMILEALYNVKTNYEETDFGVLYSAVKQHIRQRSLLLLYTNFDSMDALERQMNYLRAINKTHLLIVVFFKNTEIMELANRTVSTEQEVIQKTVAEKFIYDKELMILELSKYGVNSILTTPQNLTIDTINKYIEIKSKGLI
ncbi:uncharacterized protein (DUF58 family) [Wenyingzhuangia heitensis]|uniref:Uncharacterized protein (DUF58 family) n=1 Tax=Wenyingzhuangia heitensis TaxID=1487859 RepID=A0ABX0U5S9_9FLAO|nr:uncharacterized protein (DUF58 family) [Wenyingzhuangia heitensis]